MSCSLHLRRVIFRPGGACCRVVRGRGGSRGRRYSVNPWQRLRGAEACAGGPEHPVERSDAPSDAHKIRQYRPRVPIVAGARPDSLEPLDAEPWPARMVECRHGELKPRCPSGAYRFKSGSGHLRAHVPPVLHRTRKKPEEDRTGARTVPPKAAGPPGPSCGAGVRTDPGRTAPARAARRTGRPPADVESPPRVPCCESQAEAKDPPQAVLSVFCLRITLEPRPCSAADGGVT